MINQCQVCKGAQKKQAVYRAKHDLPTIAWTQPKKIKSIDVGFFNIVDRAKFKAVFYGGSK